MIKALLLILDPSNTWDAIEQAERNLTKVLLHFLVPVLLITGAGEAYGLMTFGHRKSAVVERIDKVPPLVTARYKIAQVALDCLVLFGGAAALQRLGASFHRRHTYTECFITLAYSLSPVFLLRLLNMIPAVNPWISWGIGILLAVSVLYRGIPRIMKPDPSSALGLYMISSLLLILISGLVQFLSLLVLQEEMWA